MKRTLYFILGLLGFLALLCSIAAAQATHEGLMKQGFLQFSQTGHLGVPASRYGEYAHAVCQYLDGKTDVPAVPSPESGEAVNAFSDKENRHLADVRGLIGGLKWMRWASGGLVIAVLAALYIIKRHDRARLLADVLRGFAAAALFLLAAGLALLIWGLINFDGLFWTFHRAVFTNDLWLLDPRTDLLMALMPLPFFLWYAGEMLKSMAPVLAIMVLALIGWKKSAITQKEKSAS